MKLCNVILNKSELKIDINYLLDIDIDLKIVISDLIYDCTYYIFNTSFQKNSSIWVVPLPLNLKNSISNTNFKGFYCKIYNTKLRLLQSDELILNDNTFKSKNFSSDPLDMVGESYVDFFYSDLLNNIDTSGVVIDAGANVGFFTLYCLQNLNLYRIYSIEPDVLPFFHLNRNFINDSRVILINKALSHNCDDIQFSFSVWNSVGSSEFNQTDGVFRTNVSSIDLNTILNLESKINLLKMDIEGTEFRIFENLDNSVYDKINQFFIEFHGTPYTIFNILQSHGYTVEYRHSNENDIAGFIYAYK